jgi:hypothetical protein
VREQVGGGAWRGHSSDQCRANVCVHQVRVCGAASMQLHVNTARAHAKVAQANAVVSVVNAHLGVQSRDLCPLRLHELLHRADRAQAELGLWEGYYGKTG